MKKLIVSSLCFVQILALLSIGCKEEIPLIKEEEELPEQQFTHSRLIITENGITTAIVEAQHVDVYESQDYTVVKDSIQIDFYNADGKHVSTLTAQNAEVWGLYEKVDSLKARGDVVIISEERNAKMETPEILWIATIHKVYADTVRLSTDDAVEEGVDFEADDDLKSYTMKNVTGEIQDQDIDIPKR